MTKRETVQIVAEPHGTTNTVDIVFVHGLEGSWEQTWSDYDLSKSWLRDFLPRDLPNARILTYGHQVLSSPGISSRVISEISISFLESLDIARSGHISPIIFVAHSLGTLILQAALVEESKRSNSTILAFTKSIVFLGGPRFDNDQDWERFGAALTRILKGSLSLSQLQFDLFSEIRSKFDTLLNQPNVSKPDICCFYETLPVYRTGILVPRNWAIISGGEDCPINANHISMTKVANATDAQYQTLCVKLKQMSAIMIAPRGIPPKSAEDMENAEPKRTNSPAPDGRELILNSGNKNEETKKLTKLALALETQGHFILASGVYGRMIEILGKRHQPDDPVMLFCSDKLASMFRDKGEYDKAEDLSLTILKARMKASGRGDIATLSTLGNLALTMRHQGRSQEAYEMLRDALEFTSTSMFQSMAHITTVSILAKLLKDCRFYDFSAFLSRDVLMASMNFLGFDDPFTLNRLSDLAVVLSKQGKYRLSEEISSRALNGLGKCLGTDHPHTLRTAKRLANYMRFQGKYDEACVRLDRTLKSQKKQLGTAHPDTLSTICGLAATYVLQGRVREGELHLRHAEREQLRVLGDQHLDTRWTAHALSLIDDFHQPFGEDVDREAAKQGMLDFLRKPSGTIPISSSKDSTKSSAPSSMTAIEAPNNPHPENIDIALRVAAMKGDEIAVQAALSRGARIDSTGGFCGTALQAASLAGHENIVNTLLKAAAQVNAQGGLFGTALCAASFGGHTVIVRRLLAAGADPNAKEGTRSSSLKAAVAMRHQDIIQALLGAHESLNSISDGTALHDASMTGQEDTVHALLEKGADPNIPTGFFGGALQAAAWAGQANIVQLLLDRGALQAAWVGQVNIAQLPRDRGAPFESHFEGHTALYLAATGGYENVMRILTQRPDVATRHSASGFADAFPAPSAAIASDTVAAAVAVGGGGKREERAGERVASAGRHSADLLGNGEGEEGQGRVPIGVKQKLKYFRRYILRKLAN